LPTSFDSSIINATGGLVDNSSSVNQIDLNITPNLQEITLTPVSGNSLNLYQPSDFQIDAQYDLASLVVIIIIPICCIAVVGVIIQELNKRKKLSLNQ
jgi:hypothetical protein